jgi:hypothetical protein
MNRRLLVSLAAWSCLPFSVDWAVAQEPVAGASVAGRKLTTRELADWIDQRFQSIWADYQVAPPPIVDDATFLRRVSLDLLGTIPSVSATRDFIGEQTNFKRDQLVIRVLHDSPDGQGVSHRSAEHMARVWRRVLVPGNGPGAGMAAQIDPWLKTQFEQNAPYDEIARRLVLARPEDSPVVQVNQFGGTLPTGPMAYQQAIGPTPENLANSLTRTFLGVRIGCAQCHNHPFASWKQSDFWGIAAFFAGVRNQPRGPGQPAPAPEPRLTRIRPEGSDVEYDARFLWTEAAPEFPDDKSPREVFADWMVSPQNPNFAATAVNRLWQYLCGRGITAAVDDLDEARAEERQVLDDLARQFAAADFDFRWLITGICQSQVYQRATLTPAPDGAPAPPGARPLKTLLPEQVFNSLEQALALPVSKVDNGPRHNGQMVEIVARMNEALGTTPEEFRGGIPQTLLIMNGQLMSKATDLKESRTLRAVVDAPFLKTEQKLDALFLATFTRLPNEAERAYLLEHVSSQPEIEKQKEAFGQVFWGLLNSPEFVLSR